jgi:hypothetical protein
MGDRIPRMSLDALQGSNGSTQYSATLSYSSCLANSSERVKVEVALREPVLEPHESQGASTALLDPNTGQPALPPVPVAAMSRRECYAEKIRAALCRREPAIRDFYDIDYALRNGLLVLEDARLAGLVAQKVSVPGNSPPSLSRARVEQLRGQISSDLNPVLREADFGAFDLNWVVEQLRPLTRGAS